QSPQAFKGAKLDGPTLHAVFYFTLREETAKALHDLESAEPSVRLLAEYFRLVGVVSGLLPEMRTRFKAIAVVNNQEVINMARLIAPFNGKPVLITESGTLMRGTRRPGAEGEGTSGSFLELDIHVRRWNFMARKGLSKLTPKFGLINVSVAFLVEGREDSEVRP
ncbi:unnamed protein product, partial [Ectocarpus sp. 12 AP-2014]